MPGDSQSLAGQDQDLGALLTGGGDNEGRSDRREKDHRYDLHVVHGPPRVGTHCRKAEARTSKIIPFIDSFERRCQDSIGSDRETGFPRGGSRPGARHARSSATGPAHQPGLTSTLFSDFRYLKRKGASLSSSSLRKRRENERLTSDYCPEAWYLTPFRLPLVLDAVPDPLPPVLEAVPDSFPPPVWNRYGPPAAADGGNSAPVPLPVVEAVPDFLPPVEAESGPPPGGSGGSGCGTLPPPRSVVRVPSVVIVIVKGFREEYRAQIAAAAEGLIGVYDGGQLLLFGFDQAILRVRGHAGRRALPGIRLRAF